MIASAWAQIRNLTLAPRSYTFVLLRVFPVMYIPKYISAPNITCKIKFFKDFVWYNSDQSETNYENKNDKINLTATIIISICYQYSSYSYDCRIEKLK